MSIFIDENGSITLYQGDTGNIVISGLDTNNNWNVYFAVQNEKRLPIGTELMASSAGNESVVITIPSSLTDLLTVPIDQDYEIYYYGLKICSGDIEHTLFVQNSAYGEKNQLIVYPRKVQGV